VNSSKEGGAPRTPFKGTIEDVGNDLREIKGMGVDHVILGLTEPEPDRVIDITVIAFL